MKLVVVFCLLLGLYEYIVWQVDLPPFCNHGSWTVAQKGTEERTPLARNVLFLISQINSLPHFLGAFAAATTKKVWMCLYFLLLLWFTGAQVYVGKYIKLSPRREKYWFSFLKQMDLVAALFLWSRILVQFSRTDGAVQAQHCPYAPHITFLEGWPHHSWHWAYHSVSIICPGVGCLHRGSHSSV